MGCTSASVLVFSKSGTVDDGICLKADWCKDVNVLLCSVVIISASNRLEIPDAISSLSWPELLLKVTPLLYCPQEPHQLHLYHLHYRNQLLPIVELMDFPSNYLLCSRSYIPLFLIDFFASSLELSIDSAICL